MLRSAVLGLALSAAAAVAQAQTVTGGPLFAASPGPIGATLLGTGGGSYAVSIYWDSVFGIPTNNQQDKFGTTGLLFSSSTNPGTTSASVVLTPPPADLIRGQSVSPTYPQGIPLMLVAFGSAGGSNGGTHASTTASIGKDIGVSSTISDARVTYGANSTAVVSFPTGGGNFSLSVGLSNVSSGAFGGGGGGVSLGGGGCK